MKILKILLFTFVILLTFTTLPTLPEAVSKAALSGWTLSGNTVSGWTNLDPSTGTSALYTISCPSASMCVTASNNTIVATYNQGSTWTTQPIPFNLSANLAIQQVYCASNFDCFAVGSYGTWPAIKGVLLSTQNGGNTWTVQSLTANTNVSDLSGLSCPSTQVCFLIGTVWNNSSSGNPAIFATQNSGETWTSQSLPSLPSWQNLVMNSISCPTVMACKVSGYIYNTLDVAGLQPIILTTSNAGASWYFQNMPPDNQGLSTVFCASDTECFALGDKTTAIYRTEDFGNSWTATALPSASLTPFSLECPNPQECFGLQSTGGILFSPNSGISWYRQYQPQGIFLYSISCPTAAECFVAGSNASGQAVVEIYHPQTILNSISPNSGTWLGGTTVTLAGTGLSNQMSVYFGNTEATSVSCTSSTLCNVTAPLGTMGETVDVDIIQNGIVAASDPQDVFNYTSPPATYQPLIPYRICDTRSGNPSQLVGPDAQCNGHILSPRGIMSVNVAGTYPDTTSKSNPQGGIPSSGGSLIAAAVVANITVTDTTSDGYMVVWQEGAPQPATSTLNWQSGDTVSGLVQIPLSGSGQINIYNYQGYANMIIDVQGWMETPASSQSGGAGIGSYYTPTTPYRICDTRSGNPSLLSGIALSQCENKALTGNQTLDIQVAGVGNVPTTADAAVINLTAINPSTAGYLTVWPAGTVRPAVSNLNFIPGTITSNSVIVPLASSSQSGLTAGDIAIYNYQGSTNITVDVSGYFTAANSANTGTFTGVNPYRICDTRNSYIVGYLTECTGHTLAPSTTVSETLTVQIAGVNPVPPDATAVVINVTVINPSAAGYLTVWPAGTVRPVVSNLNFIPGAVVSNFVTVALSSSGSSTGAIEISNYQGVAEVVVDVVGWYSPT
ncbi:MAG: IPT/TIG domain-containing protein [Actinobacteria bacterium]|nr:IPT/TIG domain-containing protein [Actinomycetota bacterium]MCL6105009.1 IPT/TIG domain-containing protein [Actinomycetota bacterium]